MQGARTSGMRNEKTNTSIYDLLDLALMKNPIIVIIQTTSITIYLAQWYSSLTAKLKTRIQIPKKICFYIYAQNKILSINFICFRTTRSETKAYGDRKCKGSRPICVNRRNGRFL